MKKEKQYEFDDLALASLDVHAKLTHIREKFLESVAVMQEMSKASNLIRSTLGDKIPPVVLDGEEELKLDRYDISDERFVLLVSNFLNKHEPTERLELIGKLITKACDQYDSVKSKHNKMQKRVDMLDRYIKDGDRTVVNPEWQVYNNRIVACRKAMGNIDKRIDFLFTKFFLVRKQCLVRVLGITELLYKALSDRKMKLDDKYLHNRYAIGDTLEQFKIVDSQNRRTH